MVCTIRTHIKRTNNLEGSNMKNRTNRWQLLCAFALVLAAAGCAEATDETSFETTQQELTTTHNWSKAPANSSGEWKVVATVTDSSNNVFLAGWLGDGSVDFGCSAGSMSNTSGSWEDAFLVKFDDTGACQWQEQWGSAVTTSGNRVAYRAEDVTLGGTNDHIFIVMSQYYDTTFGSNSTGSIVYELSDGTSSPTLEWSSILGGVSGTEAVMVSVGVDDNDNLTVAGDHSRSFKFGGVTYPSPQSLGHGTNDVDAFILHWGPLTSGTRTEDWAESFGDDGPTRVEDAAVDASSGNIAVVGTYTNEHESIGNINGTTAQVRASFLQTIKEDGTDPDAAMSISDTTDDIDFVTTTDFAPDGTLYIAGWFSEEIGENLSTDQGLFQGGGLFGPPAKTTSSAGDDYDWIVIEYTDSTQISGYSTGSANDFVQSGFAGSWTPGSDYDREVIHDIDATGQLVSVTGEGCESVVECVNYGFAHVFTRSASLPSSAPSTWNDQTVTYDSMAYTGMATSIDSSFNLIVGGGGTVPNVNFGGGALTGTDDFIVSYTLAP